MCLYSQSVFRDASGSLDNLFCVVLLPSSTSSSSLCQTDTHHIIIKKKKKEIHTRKHTQKAFFPHIFMQWFVSLCAFGLLTGLSFGCWNTKHVDECFSLLWAQSDITLAGGLKKTNNNKKQTNHQMHTSFLGWRCFLTGPSSFTGHSAFQTLILKNNTHPKDLLILLCSDSGVHFSAGLVIAY